MRDPDNPNRERTWKDENLKPSLFSIRINGDEELEAFIRDLRQKSEEAEEVDFFVEVSVEKPYLLGTLLTIGYEAK
jgi:hypothetical protein